MNTYGSVEAGSVLPVRKRSMMPYILAGGAAVVLAAVGIADLASKGASTTALAWVPMRREMVVPMANGQMLFDAALDPLYNEGEAIVPYKWMNKNGANYDPEAQNAFAEMPVQDEFRGMAPKSLAHSCDKTGGCPPEENVYDYLPDQEEKTLAKRQPNMSPPVNAWAEMPLDY